MLDVGSMVSGFDDVLLVYWGKRMLLVVFDNFLWLDLVRVY